MNKKIIVPLSLVLLLSPCFLFSETIIFKSGKNLEGKIIRKTDREIMVDNRGVLASYRLDEIESINGKTPHSYVPDFEPEGTGKDDSSLLAQAALYNGIVYLDKQMYDAAVTEFTKAIELNPHFTEAYYNRGLVHAKEGSFDKTIADYTKAIENNPRDADIYYNRGFTYYRKGSIDEAIIDYTKAIEISPNQADVYYNRALLYISKKEYDKAWDDIHKAQSLGYKVTAQFLSDLRKASGGER
ncbi:MAG: tetratricopeptide repeat protein [Candidatus Omnitrophica bacterium]|nr:tetratricopeptide repeat protein [Candidatus Omnitrophota bacterium]